VPIPISVIYFLRLVFLALNMTGLRVFQAVTLTLTLTPTSTTHHRPSYIMPATTRSSQRLQKPKPYARRARTRSATPFEDAIPSIQKLRNVKTHKKVTLTDGNGDSDVFKLGDR
jgi:hypothetical protein